MDYQFISLPKSEGEILVKVPFSEFEPYVSRAAASLSSEIEIEGFRKGKAPFDVVKNRVGEAAIYERAADLAVKRLYRNVLTGFAEERKEKGEEFIPLGRPEVAITKLAPGNEFEFKVKLAFLPSVELPDYKQIARETRGKKSEIEVKDEEIQKTIDWLKESRAHTITVDRPADVGDAVEIDFEVRHEGVKIENGESRNHPLILGKGKFIPGFEDHLVGMAAGEKKTFTLVVPETWHDKNFAGRALDIEAKMNLVQERALPELDDEFAKGLGNFDSAAHLKTSIREGIGKEKEEKEKQRMRLEIIEEIAGAMKAEIPEVLISRELEKMLEELKTSIAEMGMEWTDYLAHIKKTPDEMAEEWKPEAEKRVRAALSLREIARRERIEPSEEEIKTASDQFLRRYKTAGQAEKEIDPNDLREYARGTLRNEKVFEFLEDAA